MRTLATLIHTHGVDVDAHLDREITVPVTTGLQRQGDIIVIPTPNLRPATTAVPTTGYPVVRGEAGGNTHLLLSDTAGGVFYDLTQPRSDLDLDLGTLTVADGATGYLAHPEHGYAGIAPGTYTIRRQREQADVIRVVAD